MPLHIGEHMLFGLLKDKILVGSLHFYMPDGRYIVVGEGKPAGHLIIHNRLALAKMIINSHLYLGECYMNGDWEPGEGGLMGVIEAVTANLPFIPRQGFMYNFMRATRFIAEVNGAIKARRNVSHHYDVDESVYRAFLDKDMQYSCAYFEHVDMTLEEAQQAKCRHIAKKLLLKPGDWVLDIGCGWGGLALFMAREYGVHVTGLTLSEEQLRVAQQRAKDEKLDSQVEFVLQDYRLHEPAEGAYDAIVSVGMFEHVGRPQYDTFFDKVSALLKPDGRSLIHTIGRTGAPAVGSPWIRKYVFPGGYVPALSEVAETMEKTELVLADLEVLRLHYAETLKEWHRRFMAAREQIAAEQGERFCRMWDYYLQICIAGFVHFDLVVYQLQLAHKNDAVPITRDYLYEVEQRLPVRKAS